MMIMIYNIKKDKSISEYLAIFSDKVLRSSNILRLTEEECEFYIRNIVVLFNSLEDKDVFMNLFHSLVNTSFIFLKLKNNDIYT